MRSVIQLLLAGCCTGWPALAGAAAPSDAQIPSPAELANRDTLTVGVGVALVPDYEGSDDYRFIPVGAVRGKYHGISFSSQGSYLYVDLVPQHGTIDFDFGPVAGVRMGTRRHIQDKVVEMLPKRNHAVEAGLFAGLSFHGLTNPYDSLAFHVDVTHDLDHAHRSTIIAPNASFSTPLSHKTYASLSVGAEFVSKKFADYYYTITAADSLATGGILPAFDAGGGMKNWHSSLMIDQSLTGNLLHGLSLFGMVEYSRLVGDFKRSPIVSMRGSASQWTLASGLAYTW